MATITTADIRTMAQDLVCDGADSTALDRFATELLQDELPYLDNGWTATTTFANAVTTQATYTLSSESIRKMIAVFHGGRELDFTDAASLKALGQERQRHVGIPRLWTVEGEQDRTLRLHPAPEFSTVGTAGDIATERDRLLYLYMGYGSTLPKYLRLPAALWILAREYSRESDHRDRAFSQLCQQLAERLFAFVDGVVAPPKTNG